MKVDWQMNIAVGLAQVDITPTHPIRLSGYGVRREETTIIDTPLMAKALAIGENVPALLLTVENCGVTSVFTESVANAISQATGLKRERLAICYSHTHSAPCLTGSAPMLLSTDMPLEHQ